MEADQLSDEVGQLLCKEVFVDIPTCTISQQTWARTGTRQGCMKRLPPTGCVSLSGVRHQCLRQERSRQQTHKSLKLKRTS